MRPLSDLSASELRAELTPGLRRSLNPCIQREIRLSTTHLAVQAWLCQNSSTRNEVIRARCKCASSSK